jgi:serine/threonine-protein kinase
MDETRVNWWMDAGSQWHRGFPPSGWWQAEDGRWHPPGDDEEPTGEMREIPQAGAAHLAADGWGWPRWARNAVLASVALIAIVVVATAAITDSGGDGDGATVTADSSTTVTPSTVAAPSPETAAPPSSVAGTSIGEGTDRPAPPTTRATTTTTAAPRTSSPTSPAAGVRQGAPCSPEGATAVSQDGVPMTCTPQKCHGAPYDSARWRRTAC